MLDWQIAFYSEFKSIGNRCGLTSDWHHISNELRRQSLAKMIKLDEKESPQYNFDGIHTMVPDKLCQEF